MQEMEEEFPMLRIEDEKQGVLVYMGNTDDLGEIDTRWCLMGRFLIDFQIDF